MRFPSREQVEATRRRYPKGLRVELVSMDDPYSRLRPGDQGTVDHVDDTGTVFIRWDCGSGLGVVYGEDVIRAVGENTGLICRRCGCPVYKSDNPEYSYQCFYCDEDMYSVEVVEQDAHYLPPVMVARPVDGITINEQLEYLLDDHNEPRVFQNQPEAEGYLLAHGFTGEDLEYFYFVEVVEKEE